MIILSILAGITILGIILANTDWDDLGVIIYFIGVLCLVLALPTIPIARYEGRLILVGIESARTTLEQVRSAGDDVERTAIALKMVDYNATLARMKYNRTTIWRLWVAAEVDSTEFLR